ncbi:MAG: ABC transporter ATP-binding protein [Desulfobacteraceae bacterium]|nr:MAG: ABC transporter ATP-binding protein [Desulfobacteraceae bacterium]
MAADTGNLLSVENLSVHFHGEEETARAVEGVSFEVRRRENVCLVGESGCGKTVSALAVMGLIPCPPGRVTGERILFAGQDLLLLDDAAMEAVRGRKIGMVFQEPLTSLNPVLTIGEQIAEPLRIHTTLGAAEIRTTTARLLQDVGIDRPAERLNDYPHQLSGGQRQRVMIAMALACGPDLLIADEPTTALDVTIQAQILKLITQLQAARDMAVLYITHDLGVVSQIADRVYVMYAGLIVEHGPVAAILRDPRHPYTQALLASLPHRRKRGTRLHSIPGAVPHPAHKPPGCPFHPRCARAIAVCRIEFPDLCRFSDSHAARCPVAAGRWS